MFVALEESLMDRVLDQQLGLARDSVKQSRTDFIGH